MSRRRPMIEGWTTEEVESLADPRSLMRGLAYRDDGRVELEHHGVDRVAATVRGSMPDHVELRRTPRLSWSCTCPVGEDGEFCKHCVAVAVEVAVPEGAPGRSTRPRGEQQPDLRRYLAGLDADELVDLLFVQAEEDWRLRERLTARAIATGGGTVDVRTWRQRIDAAFGDHRYFVAYADADGWAQAASR